MKCTRLAYSWRCYFRVLTLKLSLAPLSTDLTQCCLQSFISSTNITAAWWLLDGSCSLRFCRCLIITAHLLIRAPYLTNVLVTASQCKKEGGEKSDQTWLVITIIVPSLQSDPPTFISMHILHQTEQLHVWASRWLHACKSHPVNYL